MESKPRRPSRRQKTKFLRDECRNKTGFLGVKHNPRTGRFEAYIRDWKGSQGAKVYCGSGKTAEDAARAYDRKAVELYGKRAVVNFPTPRSTPRSTIDDRGVAPDAETAPCCEGQA